jgi:hypothetical protein
MIRPSTAYLSASGTVAGLPGARSGSGIEVAVLHFPLRFLPEPKSSKSMTLPSLKKTKMRFTAGSSRISPLTGKNTDKLHRAWSLASNNLSAALSKHKVQLTELPKWVLTAADGAGVVLLQFIVSIHRVCLHRHDDCACRHLDDPESAARD